MTKHQIKQLEVGDTLYHVNSEEAYVVLQNSGASIMAVRIIAVRAIDLLDRTRTCPSEWERVKRRK